MKSFHDYNDDDDLDEGFLRGASSLVLLNHIRSQRKKIKPTGKVDARQLDALASMILASATLTFTATQFPPNEQKKGRK